MIATEHTSYVYALRTDDPAAGTAVNIDIDIDSMFYEFLSDGDIDPLLNYVPGFVCEPPTMGRPCYLVKVQQRGSLGSLGCVT